MPIGDVELYTHLLFFLREKYIALYERIKLYLLNRLTPVCILDIRVCEQVNFERRYLAKVREFISDQRGSSGYCRG